MSRFLFFCSVLLAVLMTAYAPPPSHRKNYATLRRCGMTCAQYWCFEFLRLPTPDHYRYCLYRCRTYCYAFLYGRYTNYQGGWGNNPNWPNTNIPGMNPNSPGYNPNNYPGNWNPAWGTNPGTGSSGGYAWWNANAGGGGGGGYNPLGWSNEGNKTNPGQGGGAKPTNRPVNPRVLFNSLDTDADEHLSLEEMKMVYTAENFPDIFREADKDSNELLSFDEFVAANLHRMEHN